MQLKRHRCHWLWKHILISFTLFFNYASLFFPLLSMLFSCTAKHTSFTLPNKLLLLRYFNYNKFHAVFKRPQRHPTMVVRNADWQRAICSLNLNGRRVALLSTVKSGEAALTNSQNKQGWRCCYRTFQKLLLDPALRWTNPWLWAVCSSKSGWPSWINLQQALYQRDKNSNFTLFLSHSLHILGYLCSSKDVPLTLSMDWIGRGPQLRIMKQCFVELRHLHHLPSTISTQLQCPLSQSLEIDT